MSLKIIILSNTPILMLKKRLHIIIHPADVWLPSNNVSLTRTEFYNIKPKQPAYSCLLFIFWQMNHFMLVVTGYYINVSSFSNVHYDELKTVKSRLQINTIRDNFVILIDVN